VVDLGLGADVEDVVAVVPQASARRDGMGWDGMGWTTRRSVGRSTRGAERSIRERCVTLTTAGTNAARARDSIGRWSSETRRPSSADATPWAGNFDCTFATKPASGYKRITCNARSRRLVARARWKNVVVVRADEGCCFPSADERDARATRGARTARGASIADGVTDARGAVALQERGGVDASSRAKVSAPRTTTRFVAGVRTCSRDDRSGADCTSQGAK
jgi:hypothetical protein